MTAKELMTLLADVPEDTEVYIAGEKSLIYIGDIVQIDSAAIYLSSVYNPDPLVALIACVKLGEPLPDDEESCDGGGDRSNGTACSSRKESCDS